MLFGIDYARQTIWRRKQKELAKACKEGYRLGFDDGVAQERERQNGSNGNNWMFGGDDDHH